jgi:putative glycosyltransferase
MLPMKPELSIVTTVYKSEPYLPEFLRLAKEALLILGCEHYEIVFVLDGISDGSKNLLLDKQKLAPQVKIVELSRNFGHHPAMSAGLSFATGNLIFLIDCDLEVSPLVLVEFAALLHEADADVVYGVQKIRKGAFIERTMGGLFWKIFNYLSDTKVPLNTVTERLMTRSYVDALLSMGDKNVFLAGMMHWIGYKQMPHIVQKGQREGESTYTFSKRAHLLVEAITSFSEKPLRLLFYLGLVVLVMTSVVAMAFIVRKLLYPETVFMGFTSVVVVLLFGVGMILSALGLVGIYLSKIFNQVKGRPLYAVRKVYHKRL